MSRGATESQIPEVMVGPEQLVVVGYGEYARSKYDLGIQKDVIIPASLRPLQVEFHNEGSNTISATIPAPTGGDLRILMRQSANGKPVRTSRGAPPNGTSLGQIFRIQAAQEGRSIPVHINYDKAIWSGLPGRLERSGKRV